MGAGAYWSSGGVPGTRLRLSVCATQGGRKYMEDRVHVHVGRGEDGEVEYVYAGVYDGHGGAEASEFARKHLLWTIVSQPEFHSKDDEDVLTAIQEGFLLCHSEMRKVVHTWARTASGFPSTSGTTASVAFLMRGKVFTGHVGDSGIVLGRRTTGTAYDAAALTVDHKPDSPHELQRIEEAGGQVLAKSGVMRVVWRRPLRGHTGPVRRSTHLESIPFLAVARALGDLWSYNEDSDEYVVSPRPDVDVVELDGSVESIILGSDGLWNVVRTQQSVDIVATSESRAIARSSYANHAHCLVRTALRGWGSLRADNITAIVLHMEPASASPTPLSPDALLLAQTDLCPDSALLENPSAIFRLQGPATPQLLQAEPIELHYAGNMDPPLSAILTRNKGIFEFDGPGFVNYVLVERGNERRLSNSQSSGLGLFSSRIPTSAPALKSTGSPLVRTASDRKVVEPTSPLTRSATAPTRKRSLLGDENQATGKKRLDLGASFAHGTLPSTAAAAAMPDGVHITRSPLPATAHTSQPRPHSPSSSPNGQRGRPKYVCRKHGYDCSKVKKMNQDYEDRRERERRKSNSPHPTEEASDAEHITIALPKRNKTSPSNTGSDTETKEEEEAGPSARVTRSGGRRTTPGLASRAHRATPSHHLRTPRRKAGGADPAGPIRKCRSTDSTGIRMVEERTPSSLSDLPGLEAEAPEEEDMDPLSRPLTRSPIRSNGRKRQMSEEASGPQPKRNKIWNSLVSIGRIISGSVTATPDVPTPPHKAKNSSKGKPNRL